MAVLQVCVNGARDVAEHPWLSADAEMVAADAARAVEAGADEIHVHAKDSAGRDSVAAEDVARWLGAIRSACPGVRVGVSTGAWSEPDPARRLAAVAAWTDLPDFASVNFHEEGAEELALLLQSRGVGVEAGIWDAAGLDVWRRSASRGSTMRVLIELPDETADVVREHAEGMIAHVAREEPSIPILLHGEEQSAWPALVLASAWGWDTRIGLEDVLTLPSGAVAPGNADLVRAARDHIAARRPASE